MIVMSSMSSRSVKDTQRDKDTQHDIEGWMTSYDLLETCTTYKMFRLKFDIMGLDPKYDYTETQFVHFRKLYDLLH